jgi:hypothetical protein
MIQIGSITPGDILIILFKKESGQGCPYVGAKGLVPDSPGVIFEGGFHTRVGCDRGGSKFLARRTKGDSDIEVGMAPEVGASDHEPRSDHRVQVCGGKTVITSLIGAVAINR